MINSDLQFNQTRFDAAVHLCDELQRLLIFSDAADETLLSARLAQALDCAEDRARELCHPKQDKVGERDHR